MIKKIILILLIVFILGAGSVYFYRNYIVEQAIEKSGTYVMGVETDLGSAGLEIGDGSLELNNYTIKNPENFNQENLLVIEHGFLAVKTGSVFDDEFIVDSLILDGIQINFEQKGTANNLKTLMDNIKKLDFGSEEKSEKKIKVGKVAVRNLSGTASLEILKQKKPAINFKVQDFTINDLGAGDGLTLNELTAEIFKRILNRSAQQGSSLDLEGKVDELKDDAQDKIEDEAKKQLDKLGL